MKTFLYLRVDVGPADPNRVTLIGNLLESLTGKPQPDVIPHTDPGAIQTHHCFVEASSEGQALLKGRRQLPPPVEGVVSTDQAINVAAIHKLGSGSIQPTIS